MATTILHPRDCITLISPHSRSRINPNQMRSRRRKRSPVITSDNGRSRSKSEKRLVDSRSAAKQLVMGQVKILKRGEKLEDVKLGLGEEDIVLSSMDRIGPEPDTVTKQIRFCNESYAGSPSTLASPPPSSLPFPAFFAKKEKLYDAATTDLRRLLRLDLI